MRRVFFVLSVVALFCITSVNVFSVNSTGGSTVISTTIAPTYTVIIPENTSVAFNATTTAIGSVKMTEAQIEPNMVIYVTASYDKLRNAADNTKTIAYTLKSGGVAFNGAYFSKAGDKSELNIDILQSAWSSAYAGSYTDTITFNISYIASN